jgi:hypothetical protein
MNDESRTALIEHLRGAEYNGKSAEQAHDYFHSPQTVYGITEKLKPVTSQALFSLLGKQSRATVGDWVNLPLLTDNLKQQNREGLGMLLTMLFDSGKITQTEYGNAMALLQATEQVKTTTIEDAPIVRVLYGIKDPGRPNAIPLDEFTTIFQEARG